jgi:hypothetical protein
VTLPWRLLGENAHRFGIVVAMSAYGLDSGNCCSADCTMHIVIPSWS